MLGPKRTQQTDPSELVILFVLCEPIPNSFSKDICYNTLMNKSLQGE